MNIKNEVVFITGANRGLGLAFALEALAKGAAKVYAGMRKTENFSVPGLIPVQLDVTDPKSIERAVALCGDVSILVNNAGIAELVSGALDSDVEQATRRMLEVNYFGIVRLTQAFAPVLADKSHSAIINVLSDVSWKVNSILTPYSVSKAAAWSYTNHARVALKEQNTQVVGLHVGFVDTDLAAGVDLPKSDPRVVAAKSYDVLAAGGFEVLADTGTVTLKASLSSEKPEYVFAAI